MGNSLQIAATKEALLASYRGSSIKKRFSVEEPGYEASFSIVQCSLVDSAALHNLLILHNSFHNIKFCTLQ